MKQKIAINTPPPPPKKGGTAAPGCDQFATLEGWRIDSEEEQNIHPTLPDEVTFASHP